MAKFDLSDNDAAVVFEEDGTIRLLLPKGNDEDPVPMHAQLASIVAIKASSDDWVRQALQDLHNLNDDPDQLN